MLTRKIPSDGTELPVVGCGTWRGFDVGTDARQRARLREVLRVLFEAGGTVIDSSPMYGTAEAVVGDLLSAMQAHDKAFVATKVWTQGRTAGIEQMRRSLQRLGGDHLALMQVHNLVDWKTQLATLGAWQADGIVKYVGITHYSDSAHADLEAVMRAQQLDFVQLNYSLEERAAENRLLPLAAERGIAVLVNRPLGGGALLRRLQTRQLPGWAGDLNCRTWAQVLLKYVIAHPAVTCVIPGTGNPDHMAGNVHAGLEPLPDAALRARMARDWQET